MNQVVHTNGESGLSGFKLNGLGNPVNVEQKNFFQMLDFSTRMTFNYIKGWFLLKLEVS